MQLLWEALSGAAEGEGRAAGLAAAIEAARPALTVAWGVSALVADAAARLEEADEEGKASDGGLPPLAGLFADAEALSEAAAQLREVLRGCLSGEDE